MSFFKRNPAAVPSHATPRAEQMQGIADIRRAYPSFTPHTDRSVALFLTQQLDELDAADLQRITGESEPSAERLLDFLAFQRERRGTLKGTRGVRILDYALRGGDPTTVLSLHYGEDGELEHIEMEG